MTEIALTVRYPSVGEYGEGSIPQDCYDELVGIVQNRPTAMMLTQLVNHAGREGVAFVTSGEDGVSVFDDGESEIVFAIGEDVLFPEEHEVLSLGQCIKGVIMRYYVEEGPLDDSAVHQALVDEATSESESMRAPP